MVTALFCAMVVVGLIPTYDRICIGHIDVVRDLGHLCMCIECVGSTSYWGPLSVKRLFIYYYPSNWLSCGFLIKCNIAFKCHFFMNSVILLHGKGHINYK